MWEVSPYLYCSPYMMSNVYLAASRLSWRSGVFSIRGLCVDLFVFSLLWWLLSFSNLQIKTFHQIGEFMVIISSINIFPCVSPFPPGTAIRKNTIGRLDIFLQIWNENNILTYQTITYQNIKWYVAKAVLRGVLTTLNAYIRQEI